MPGLENEPESKPVIRMMKSAEAKELLKEIRALLKNKNIPDQILTTYTKSYLQSKKVVDLADPLYLKNKHEFQKDIAHKLNQKTDLTEHVKKTKPKKS